MWIIKKKKQKKIDHQHQEIRKNLNNEKTASLTKAFCTALDAHRKKSPLIALLKKIQTGEKLHF